MTNEPIGILVVDDEVDFARGISRLIKAAFPKHKVLEAYSGVSALQIIEVEKPAVVLLDLLMPGLDGHSVLHEALQKDPHLSVIILTAHGTVETAVSSIKKGAWDFLTKPVSSEDLMHTLTKALERSRLLGENKRLTELMSRSEIHRTIIGDSPAIRTLKEAISAVAATNYTVLVQGESGTGKELVAESIHRLSDRKNKPFIRVNCPAIPEQLLESELFGHTKGAFTGAVASRKGMFLEAAGGVLLLDEIGDIPLNVQTKLLRVLQDGEIRPVGATQVCHTDTRVVAMTNLDLEAKIKQGTFREDLYYRLKVLTLHAPPLRERREDIPLLAAHFLRRTCEEMGVPEKRFSPELMGLLCQQDWQGNVRELQNAVRRMAVFSSGLELKYLSLKNEVPVAEESVSEQVIVPYKTAKQQLVDAFTREYLQQLLDYTKGNISYAARISGLERVSLQKIMKRLQFNPKHR